MFYQAGIPQRNFVYPQQMIPRRWAPGQAGPQMMRHPINYQLMPINGGRPGAPGAGGGQRGGGRGGRGGGRQGAAGPQGMQQRAGAPQGQGQGQQGPGYKYTDNVRNRDQPRAHQAQPQAGAEVPAPVPSATEPLTIKALANASEDQQKQMIGERLFPLIKQQQPVLAGKITGMLLEMDNGELIHLLESPQALTEKIKEAMAVLQEADPEANKEA